MEWKTIEIKKFHLVILVLLTLIIIFFSGYYLGQTKVDECICKECVCPESPSQTTTTTTTTIQTIVKKSLAEVLEKVVNAEASPGSALIEVTNVKKNHNLTIEYIAYSTNLEPGHYSYMKKVATSLDSYLKERNESYQIIQLVSIAWQSTTTYTLTITPEQLSDYASGKLGFEEWKQIIVIKGQ